MRTNKLTRIVDTDERDWSATAARIILGLVILPHGAQKLLGWFGGHGFSGTMEFFTQSMGVPAALAVLVIMLEFFGALSLIAGLLGRLNALGIAAIMMGAVQMVHVQHGFFMNWSGAQAGEGYEYHLLAIGLAIVVMIRGSGALSIDAWLGDKLRSERGEAELKPTTAEEFVEQRRAA